MNFLRIPSRQELLAYAQMALNDAGGNLGKAVPILRSVVQISPLEAITALRDARLINSDAAVGKEREGEP